MFLTLVDLAVVTYLRNGCPLSSSLRYLVSISVYCLCTCIYKIDIVIVKNRLTVIALLYTCGTHSCSTARISESWELESSDTLDVPAFQFLEGSVRRLATQFDDKICWPLLLPLLLHRYRHCLVCRERERTRLTPDLGAECIDITNAELPSMVKGFLSACPDVIQVIHPRK